MKSSAERRSNDLPGHPTAAGLLLADGLELPLDAVTQKFAFLAQSGAGKSYAGMKLAEEMLRHQMHVIVLDPVGVWWGLRSSADGKTAGLAIAVFGGEHGDLPLSADAGGPMADLVVDEAISAVLDVSDFELPDLKRFVAAFAERFFQRKKRTRGPVHLFLDEVQTFAPQMPERDETVMLNRVERIARIGRNYGIGWSAISQRPQEVHKKVLNQAGTLLALRTIGRHERKAITDWVADKAQSEAEVKLLDGLASLETGVARVWSPSFLKIACEVRIARRCTFDSSATPALGTVTGEPRTRLPVQVDVERLRRALDTAMAPAGADDDQPEPRPPSARPERQVRPPPQQTRVEIRIEGVAAPVLAPALALELRLAVDAASAAGHRLTAAASALTRALDGIARETPARARRPAAPPVLRIDQGPRSHWRPPPTPATPQPVPRADTLTGPQQRVIDAMATLRNLGLDRPRKTAVAAVAGYVPTSGGFTALLRQLKTAGWIDYPLPGLVSLTEQGAERGTPQLRLVHGQDTVAATAPGA